MPSSTPDWSALASQNEKVVGGQAAGEQPQSVPAPPQGPGQPGRHRNAAPSRRPRWRGRASRGAAAVTAAVVAVTGAASASASALAASASSPARHIVKRVHALEFTYVTAVGATGGWAFTGHFGAPTAWRRSGASWTQVPFPGKAGESVFAAGASSASNVWAFTDGSNGSRALRWNGRGWAAERTFSRQIGGAVVLSRDDAWVFGQPFVPGGGLGTWHFDGHAWTHVPSGHGLEGGSGLSSGNVWGFAGTDVAHWNGRTWSRTSVQGLLPARSKEGLNDPAVVGILAAAPRDIWAIGSGNTEDEGGPTVVLHYNGHAWRKVAQGSFGVGTFPLQQVSADGHGGLWIPMPGFAGRPSYLVHYAAGRLTEAALPARPRKIDVTAVALIPHTSQVLGAGFTHAFNNPGIDVSGVILQYKR